MIVVKKFTSFDELKSCESMNLKYASSLKKQNDLEKLIVEIRSNKILQSEQKNFLPLLQMNFRTMYQKAAMNGKAPILD